MSKYNDVCLQDCQYKNYRRPKHDIATKDGNKKIINLVTWPKQKLEEMGLKKIQM